MKKHTWILLTLSIITFTGFAQFGSFASAVYMSVDNGATKNWYNTQKLAGDPNAIGASNFTGDFGSFASFSGAFLLHGAEVKSFRGSRDNVCGAKLNFRIYPISGNGGSFTQQSLPFFANCNDGVFSDGKGPCNPTDQKWQKIDGGVDLTSLEPGHYILELYYEVSGMVNSSDKCDETQYDSNLGQNYKITYTVTKPLPVKLLNFTGQKTKNEVLLQWTTATEENNQHFVIMHSTNGQNFVPVGTLAGKGNSSSNQRYLYKHNAPASSNHYYQLKQVDKDGKHQLSEIIKVGGMVEMRLSLYPNPASQLLQIGGLQSGEPLLLLDITGRVLKQFKASGATQSIPVHTLAPGKYIITSGQGSQRQQLSFVKE